MSFTVVHGGMIRRSAVVASGESTYWSKGRLLSLNSSGQIIVNTAPSTNTLVGVAMEDRINTSSPGNSVTVLKAGAPTGDRYSFLLDNSVIEMEQNLESGITFAPGNKLYCSTNGKVTTSGNSVGSYSPVIGVALSDAFSNDQNRKLTWNFNVQY